MDYTKLPASLIFHKRESLEEYLGSNNLIRALVENMVEIDYLNNGDFEEKALNSINTAYYICTIIMLEKYPVWRWSFYLREAEKSQNNPFDSDEDKQFVMALVYVFLSRFNTIWCVVHQNLMKRLFLCNYPGCRYDSHTGELDFWDSRHPIIRKLTHALPSMKLPNDIFAPCTIDDNAIRNAEIEMAQQNMGWQELTNDFNPKATKDLMDAVCKNDRERVLLAKAIKTEASKLGMNIEVDYLQSVDNAIAEADTPVDDHTAVDMNSDEIAALKARIKQQEENRQVKEPLPMQSIADNQDEKEKYQDEIESLKAQLAASNDCINALEKEIKELRDFKLEIEDLNKSTPEERLAIDERAIFFSSAIGMDFDPKRTNQTQLGIMISTLSGDNPKSIRGRISKMHTMEKNNHFSEEVLQAARNVKVLLEKVPKGNQPQKLKDIIDNIDLVFLNSNNS